MTNVNVLIKKLLGKNGKPVKLDLPDNISSDDIAALIDKAGGFGSTGPHNTVKAYKLFKTKKATPGELYPLFVDSKNPVVQGKWTQAISGDMTDKGKVKSSIGPLAYRPGWHAGDSPSARHIGGGRDPKTGKPTFRPDNQAWAEVEMADDLDWQDVADSRARITKAGKKAAGTAQINDRIPYRGHYRYKTNPNMEGEWLIGGDMRINRILSDEQVSEINKKAGVEDLPRKIAKALKGLAGIGIGVGAMSRPREANAGQSLWNQISAGREQNTYRPAVSPAAARLSDIAAGSTSLLGNPSEATADWLNKLAYGDNISWWDRGMAAMELMDPRDPAFLPGLMGSAYKDYVHRRGMMGEDPPQRKDPMDRFHKGLMGGM